MDYYKSWFLYKYEIAASAWDLFVVIFNEKK